MLFFEYKGVLIELENMFEKFLFFWPEELIRIDVHLVKSFLGKTACRGKFGRMHG